MDIDCRYGRSSARPVVDHRRKRPSRARIPFGSQSPSTHNLSIEKGDYMNTIILRKHFATILLAFAATLLFAASSASASQNVTTCGATISKAGTYILAADLDCSGTD